MDVLDLDKLAPSVKKVKISGKVIDLHPAKVKNIIEIQKLFLSFKHLDKASEEEQVTAIDRIVEVLRPIVPDIDNVDFTTEQLMALLKYASTQGTEQSVKKGAQNQT